MSGRQQSTKPLGRNSTIARDLEDLPVELIEQIIRELTFEKMIRLSIWAGPQLTRAVTSSLTWRHFFGNRQDWTIWQRCLQLTHEINILCYDTKKKARPLFDKRDNYYGYRWNNGTIEKMDRDGFDETVSFLQDQGENLPRPELVGVPKWMPQPEKTVASLALQRRWLKVLNLEMRHNIHAKKLTKGYLPVEHCSYLEQLGKGFGLEQILMIDDLERIAELFQQALAERTKAMTDELRCLADLYEVHHQLLKEPFAPQSPRPNSRHIPQQIRSRAQRLERVVPSLEMNTGKCRTYFQNDFPLLVPYDWTLRLFMTMMEKDKVDVDEKCQMVLDGMAHYYTGKTQGSSAGRTGGTPWSLLSDRQRIRIGFLAGEDGPTRWHAHSHTPFSAHGEGEIRWLTSYVEVVARLVQKFPKEAEAAKAAEDM